MNSPGAGDPDAPQGWLVSPEELEKYSRICADAGKKVLGESIKRAERLARAEEEERLAAARFSQLFTALLAMAAALQIAGTALLGEPEPWAAGCLYAGSMLAWHLLATRARRRPPEEP